MDGKENIAAILALARRKLNEGKPSFALQAVVAALRAHGGEEAVGAALRQARTQYHGSVDNTPETDQLAALFAQCAMVQPEFAQAFHTTMNAESSQSFRTALPQEAHNDASMNQEMEDVDRIRGAESKHVSVGPGGMCPQQLMDPVRSGILARLEGAPSSSGPKWESGNASLGESRRGGRDEGQPDQESRVPILAESGRLQVVVDASADGSSFTCPLCQGVVNFQRQKEHNELWCTGMH